MIDTLPRPSKTLNYVKLYQTFTLDCFVNSYWLQDSLSTLSPPPLNNSTMNRRNIVINNNILNKLSIKHEFYNIVYNDI